MRKECGCGCGMKLTFVDRRIAKRAATVKGQVSSLREKTLPPYAETHSAEEVQELRDFIRNGHGDVWRGAQWRWSDDLSAVKGASASQASQRVVQGCLGHVESHREW